MERKCRKPNRIREYDYSQNGAYFITICTQNRQKLLSDVVGGDAHIVPKPYGQIVEKYIRNAPEIEKYGIMPDHIHMIIRLEDGTMWASVPYPIHSPKRHKRKHIITFSEQDGETPQPRQADRPSAVGRGCHSRSLSPTLPGIQKGAVERQRIGKGLRHQQNHSL